MNPNEMPLPDPSEIETRVLFNWIFKMMIRDLDEQLRTQEIPLSSLQYGVLRILRHGTQILSELSQRMLLSPATLVPVIDALAKQGYIHRERDPSDRRRVQLSLTEEGSAFVRELTCQPHQDTYQKAWRTLNTDQQIALLSLLRQIVANMSESPAEVEARIAEIVQAHLRHTTE